MLSGMGRALVQGRHAVDEPVEGKMETRAAHQQGGVGAARGVAALAPPGSMVDGLGAVALAECDCARCGARRPAWR